MLKELLMLQHLGIEGALINYIVKHFSSEDRASLFTGGAFELQFKYNVFSDNHLRVFYDDNKLKHANEIVDSIIEKSNEQNIRILSYYDKEYPSNLKAIKNSPLFVHVKGDINVLNTSKSIACVGTRTPSEYALGVVGEIVKELVEDNTVIISGLAKGIDAQSHKDCLTNKGRTIAVMAHGLDTIYPRENSELAESILENGGVLLSEYAVGTKGHKSHFVARNRIVSGLSEGVIVFEASEKSGTMHTARFAYKQGKKIFCPNISLDNEIISSGVSKLLTTGSAIPITRGRDIIKQLFVKEKLSLELELSKITALEKISKDRGVSVNTLLDSIILNFIQGEMDDE